ncbi:hypothetical protein ACFSTI_26975 [Rhizorhabdus histidinilytica]
MDPRYPPANLRRLGHAAAHGGGRSIPLARLVSALPAVVLLVLAVRTFSKRLPDEAPFFAIFLLLMLSTPAAVRAFSVYRGDFWQLAAFAIQILLVRHVLFVQQDYRRKTDAAMALFALPATFAAITLDYGGALFGGIVAMATILAAIARGLRRWARSLLITMALAVATVIAMISWQASSWTANFDLYQNWIEMGYVSAGSILGALLFGTVLHNPVALAGAISAARNGAGATPASRSSSARHWSRRWSRSCRSTRNAG